MRAVGIILAGGENDRLGKLTDERASSAMPVGGCYRAIDFTLSNMTNSGIKKVAVITQYNSRSLHDHLSSSKWWDFGDKSGGMFVFTPFKTKNSDQWFRGTADSMYQNLTFLRRSKEQYAIITSGDGVYKMDYNALIDFHKEKGAEITIACKDLTGMDVRNFGVVNMDDERRIVGFEEKPLEAESSIISLGIYVVERERLIEMLEEANKEGHYNFVRDVLVRRRKQMNTYGYLYGGYWATINSIDSYYNINMDFLRPDVREAFFKQEPYIATKNKDEPPAKYNIKANVRNCLIGGGSIIDGDVQNSVLFRSVHIKEGAHVSGSVLMEGCKIGEGCVVENAILDKNVELKDYDVVKGEPGNPKIIMKSYD